MHKPISVSAQYEASIFHWSGRGQNKGRKFKITRKVFWPSSWKAPRTLRLKNRHFVFQKFYNPAYKLYRKYMYLHCNKKQDNDFHRCRYIWRMRQVNNYNINLKQLFYALIKVLVWYLHRVDITMINSKIAYIIWSWL